MKQSAVMRPEGLELDDESNAVRSSAIFGEINLSWTIIAHWTTQSSVLHLRLYKGFT